MLALATAAAEQAPARELTHGLTSSPARGGMKAANPRALQK